MAINIPILTEFDSKGLQSAQGAFNNFRSKVNEADGAMGKFKAGGTAALDAVKANAGMLAAAGGAAVAAFAVKAVTAFNESALAAGKFADATGLSVEESSRWTEVAGDLGIEATSVQKAIDRMNKSIATNIPEWKQLGAEIAYTSAGAVDVNKTFLNTIDALRRIEDPTKRAELAAKTLGKGWQDMAELINQGSATLEDSLASVSDAKVIDEAELRKAREFREALDNLKDQGEDFALSVGEFLVPILSDLLGILNDVIGAVQAVLKPFKAFTDFMSGDGLETLVDNYKAHEELNDQLKESWSAYYSSRRAAETLTRALEDSLPITAEVEQQWAKLLGTISDQEAWNNLLDALDDTKRSSYEALVEGTAESARRAQNEMGRLTQDIYEYVQGLGNIPPQVQTQILALLNRGAFDEAIALLENIRRGAVAPITGTVGGIPVGPGETPSEVRPPTFRPPAKLPKIPIGTPGGAGKYSAVTVNVSGSVISENDLVETVRKGLVNAQRNGAGLVYTNR